MDEELVSLTEVLIDTCNALIYRQITKGSPSIINCSGRVRQRHVFGDDVQGYGIDPVCGDHISSELRAGRRINDGRRAGREVSLALLTREDNSRPGTLLNGSQAFVTQEEEGFVVYRGAPESGAVLILLQDVLGERGWGKVVPSVHGIIAQIFEQ